MIGEIGIGSNELGRKEWTTSSQCRRLKLSLVVIGTNIDYRKYG
jgi:hypothetical protein